MGSKRIGLARQQALIENLKRELSMNGTSFVSASIQGTSQLLGGTGAVSGTTTAPTTKITTLNGETITTITLDLTNLSASGENGLIVGNKEAAAVTTAPAYLLKWDTATNGICYKVEMSCVELPTGNGASSFLDFDLETDDAELEFGGNPSSNNVVILNGGTVAAGTTKQNLAVGTLGNNQFLYLVNGSAPGATGATQFSTGQFIIKLYGHTLWD